MIVCEFVGQMRPLDWQGAQGETPRALNEQSGRPRRGQRKSEVAASYGAHEVHGKHIPYVSITGADQYHRAWADEEHSHRPRAARSDLNFLRMTPALPFEVQILRPKPCSRDTVVRAVSDVQ